MSNSQHLHNLEVTRNTEQQLQWYRDLDRFIRDTPWSETDKITYFPLFAPRQVIARFLECYEFYKMVMDVPGSFVEAGVGSGSFLMGLGHFCTIFEGYHYTRKIIGFDTFAGFVEPSEKDRTSGAAHMAKGGLAWDSYEVLRSAIALWDRNRVLGHLPKVDLVKGDVSATLPPYLEQNPHLMVALLHLDLDLYQPTRDTLAALIGRMPKGGLIVLDEPNHQDYPGETIAVQEVIGISKLRLKRLPMSSMAAYAVID